MLFKCVDKINVIVNSFSGAEVTFLENEQNRKKFKVNGYFFEIDDLIEINEVGIQVIRKIVGNPTKDYIDTDVLEGINIGFTIPISFDNNKNIRFCIPSMIYSNNYENKRKIRHSYMEDRLTGPMVMAYEGETGDYYCLSKLKPSRFVMQAIRNKGDSKYFHKTNNVSIGYCVDEENSIYFESNWPYEERDKSSALSADEKPAVAFYPLDGNTINVELSYMLCKGNSSSFAEASYRCFGELANNMKEMGEDVVLLPCTEEESRQYRLISLAKSYREFDKDGAGFFFHFNPLHGYGSRPSGFSTCYDTIPHNSYTHILEYGFTGRQINAAYIMASEKGGEWLERGKKVIDFYLRHCQLKNGWLYSLYDLNKKAPFYSFGDPEAPKLHYISKTSKKGNYLRTMTEPMNDLLECYKYYKDKGDIQTEWKYAILKYADFLVRNQNEDGSWFRAYCPDEKGTDSIDRGDIETEKAIKGQKSVTSIPLVFLSNVCRLLREEKEDEKVYLETAIRAGDYVLRDMVKDEHYQGATLDNPNQVDKEASQYVMAGLCQLYLLTKDYRYLDGAENAAYVFVTWNYIWNAPMQEGNILFAKNFKTKGMGAINSVWGGGVVDIYSLFHIKELYIIGKLKGHSLMCEMANWIASATAQIMSRPDDDMGFADVGMQPEGFGICPQGIDEGMIQKGDIWGTLGWIYSAGIYGLNNYLKIKEEM